MSRNFRKSMQTACRTYVCKESYTQSCLGRRLFGSDYELESRATCSNGTIHTKISLRTRSSSSDDWQLAGCSRAIYRKCCISDDDYAERVDTFAWRTFFGEDTVEPWDKRKVNVIDIINDTVQNVLQNSEIRMMVRIQGWTAAGREWSQCPFVTILLEENYNWAWCSAVSYFRIVRGGYVVHGVLCLITHRIGFLSEAGCEFADIHVDNLKLVLRRERQSLFRYNDESWGFRQWNALLTDVEIY